MPDPNSQEMINALRGTMTHAAPQPVPPIKQFTDALFGQMGDALLYPGRAMQSGLETSYAGQPPSEGETMDMANKMAGYAGVGGMPVPKPSGSLSAFHLIPKLLNTKGMDKEILDIIQRGKLQSHNVVDDTGKYVGGINTNIYPEAPQTVHVNAIYGPGRLGSSFSDVRSLVRALKGVYPDAKELTGTRITGSRKNVYNSEFDPDTNESLNPVMDITNVKPSKPPFKVEPHPENPHDIDTSSDEFEEMLGLIKDVTGKYPMHEAFDPAGNLHLYDDNLSHYHTITADELNEFGLPRLKDQE